MVKDGDTPPVTPWLLVSGYPPRSGTGTWGMRADAYIRPAQKGSQPPGAGRAAPSWHRTSSSLLSRVPTSHGNTSSKTRKQPWGEGSPRKGEPQETTWRSWILQEAAAPEAGGACSHRRPVRGGCGGGRSGRQGSKPSLRKKEKQDKSSFPHILFSWSRL